MKTFLVVEAYLRVLNAMLPSTHQYKNEKNKHNMGPHHPPAPAHALKEHFHNAFRVQPRQGWPDAVSWKFLQDSIKILITTHETGMSSLITYLKKSKCYKGKSRQQSPIEFLLI